MAFMRNDNSEVLLSICIPTFNRAAQLDETLKSITNQKIFSKTNKIEIIISDNCSSDGTLFVVNKYKVEHQEKIVYSKNVENIFDKNFEKVLSLANGCFLKLNNDTLINLDGGLEKMLKLIEENLNKKPTIFFSNGGLKVYKHIKGTGLDFFISNVSIKSTWIASFGIWKTTFDTISDFSKNSKLQLTQTDVLFRVIKSDTEVIIDDEVHFETLNITKKGGYDLLEIFFDNYKLLLEKGLVQNNLSLIVYKKELKKILFTFFCHWIALIKVYPEKYTFSYKNYKAKFSSNYNIAVYLLFQIKLNLLVFKYNLKKCINLK